MSSEAFTKDWTNPADFHGPATLHPAGDIRLPSAPSAGHRVRLLAGMTALNGQSTITSISVSII